MGTNTNVVLTNTPSGGATWSLSSTGFSNPSYLGGALLNTGLYDSTGFDIGSWGGVAVSFEGTYGTQTVVHEQTIDSTGATGWFPVVGYAVDGSSSGSGVSAAGVAYVFPVVGLRHRIRVTGLGSGTLQARANAMSNQAVVAGDTSTPGVPGPTITNTITSNQSVTLLFGSPNYGTFGYSISGTWTGLIVVEGTVDGTNWTATTAIPLNGTAVGAFTANSIGQGSAAGLAGIRFRGNVVTSGTATVYINSSEGTSAVNQDNLNWSVNLAQLNGTNVSASANPIPVSRAIGTAITATSGNVANATATATLAGTAAKTTYITGFQITASGATAGNAVSVTVAGVITGTMTYTFVFPAGVTTAANPLIVNFSTPVPASAANTAIVITLPASGTGGTNATVNAQGYQL